MSDRKLFGLSFGSRIKQGIMVIAMMLFGAANALFADYLPAVDVGTAGWNYTQQVAGDFDGDGDNDFIIVGDKSNDGTGDYSLFKNDGKGNFTEISITGLPSQIFSNRAYLVFKATDFNGDGKLDLFISNGDSSNMRIAAYINNGDGSSFTEQTPITGVALASASFGDLDGDGDLDIIAFSKMYHNGSFWVSADNNKIWYLKNNGNGASFTSTQIAQINETGPVDGGTMNLVAADIEIFDIKEDSNEDLDFVISASDASGNIEGVMLVYSNDGNNTGTFTQQVKLVDSYSSQMYYNLNSNPDVIPLDYDNDGDIDYLHTSKQTNVVLFRNNGNGTFTTDRTLTGLNLFQATYNSFVDDIDNDGDNDVLSVSYTLGIYLNNGDGTWSNQVWNDVPFQGVNINSDYGSSLSFADFDGDGVKDIVNSVKTDSALKFYGTAQPNNAPVITSTPVTTINQNVSYEYNLSATDADNDSLTWAVKFGMILPSWLALGETTAITTVAGSTYGNTDGQGTSALFGEIYSPVLDGNGNIYLLDQQNSTIRKIDSNNNVTTIAGGWGFVDGQGTNAKFKSPKGLARDSSGNLYVADTENHSIRKVDTSGNVTTIAGNGTSGDTDAQGTNARFNNPNGVTVDGNGNIFVADLGNNKIRKIDSSGNVTTFVSNINTPTSLVFDSSGNLYVTERDTHRVKKITSDGTTVTTIAGSGTSGYIDAQGTSAKFYMPQGITIDSNGYLYVADFYNKKFRKIDNSGNVTTIASDITFTYSATGIVVDNNGLVYVSGDRFILKKLEGTRILRGTPTTSGNYDVNLTVSDGTDTVEHNFQITVTDTTAPTFDIAPSVNTTTRTTTKLNASIDESGTIYYIAVASGATAPTSTEVKAGVNYGSVTKVANGSVATTGTGFDGNFTISGLEIATDYDIYVVAQDIATTPNLMATPTKVTLTTATNNAPTVTSTALTSVVQNANYSYTLGASDVDNDPLTWTVKSGSTLPSWLSTASVALISTVAGNGTNGFEGDGAAATSAKLDTPFDVARDSSGNIYIVDSNNNRIRKIDTNGNITTVAGDGTGGFGGDNGAATSAQINTPRGIAIDSSGNIYIADTSNHRIRKVATNGTITTIAGTGTEGYSGDGGAAISAQFYYPYSLAFDSDGNLYVADMWNKCIRKIDTNGDISTVAGTGTYGYSGDGGVATSAQISQPFGIAIDSNDNLYIADTYNDRIRKVTAITGIITTIAGDGTNGFSGDGGNATDAQLNNPFGVAVDSSGKIYIADSMNSRIRKVDTNGTISTLAGGGSGVADGGNALSAILSNPTNVAVDNSGNIYIANSNANKIEKIVTSATQLSGTPTEIGVYDVNMTVSDGNGGVTPHNFQITVTSSNNAPSDITLSSNTIAENSVSSTTIGTLSATDVDSGDSATFSFCGGSDDTNFTITGITLKSSSVFDYETKSSYSICVRVIDSGSATFDKNITISITDVNENSGGSTPTPTPINGTCGSSNGSTLLLANITNKCSSGTAGSITDAGTTYTWSCSGIDGGTTASCSATEPIANISSGTNTTATSGLTGTTSTTESDKEVLTATTTNNALENITIKAELPTDSTSEIKTKHSVTIGTKKTEAISKLEATVDIKSDKSVETKASKDTTDIVVTAKPDGTAEHTVTLPSNVVSKATSNIIGANTVIDGNGTVETMAGDVNTTQNGVTYTIKAVAETKSDGKTITKFVKVNTADETDVTVIGNTVLPTTPFEAGTNVIIDNIDGTLYIKTSAPLDENLVIE
jgi:uncharacterized protein YjiK